MTTVYLISDTHFGHANILNFTRADGVKLRPQFATVEEMDQYMVEAWNSVVRPQDHVYHLGDVTMKAPGLGIVRQLNGHKRLVRGNHDIFKTRMYIAAGFEEIYGVRVLADLVFSHIPLHPGSLRRNWTNVHGHIHNNESDTPFTPVLGPRYYNASVEVLNYVPRTLEQVKAEASEWIRGYEDAE